MLTGALAPDSGAVRSARTCRWSRWNRAATASIPPSASSDTLTGGRGDTLTVGGQSKHVMSYMKDFLFSPEQARTPVGVLSGGERGRLVLARALAQPSNLLVLDEPTNDLDLETLDLLQEMIADYPGTVLIVSHDRDFLDRVATSVIVVGRRGAMAGICGRLFGHGRPARRGREGPRSRGGEVARRGTGAMARRCRLHPPETAR